MKKSSLFFIHELIAQPQRVGLRLSRRSGHVRAGWIVVVAVFAAIACSPGNAPKISTEDESQPIPKAAGEQTATASLTIVPVDQETLGAAVRVVPQPSRLRLDPGATVALAAVSYDGDTYLWIGVDYRWEMVDPRAGSVDQNGIFTAGFEPGQYPHSVRAIATASDARWDGEIYGFVNVVISETPSEQPRLSTLEVFPKEIRARPGQTIRLVAVGYDQNGRLIPGTRLTWYVDELIGEINSIGYLKITASSGRFANAIQVTGSAFGEYVSGFGTLDVVSAEDSARFEAYILPNQIYLTPGEEYQFVVTNSLTGSGRSSTVGAVWSMANSAAGGISPSGRFTAGSIPGSYALAVIVEIVGSVDGRLERAIAMASVVVLPDPALMAKPTSIRILPSEIILLPNQRMLMRADVRNAGSDLATGFELEWKLADPRIGSIGPNGVISVSADPGEYPGLVTVTARFLQGGVEEKIVATADLIIVGKLSHVSITPLDATVSEQGTIRFSARGFDENMVEIQALSFRWRVLDDLVGNINQQGVFSAIGEPGAYPDVVQVTAVQSDSDGSTNPV